MNIVGVSEALATYQALLARWNARINLIAPGQDVARRHFDDCLQLVPFIHPGHNVDVGSGAGFPGLVLALATGFHFHLVESDRRKAAFLTEVVRATGAPATIHAERIERFHPCEVDLVVARAFAPLNRFLEQTSHLTRPATRIVLLKGQQAENELRQAARSWAFALETHPSTVSPTGSVLVLRDVRRHAV